jgi:type IV pili sensor histidine kinase/response regulator
MPPARIRILSHLAIVCLLAGLSAGCATTNGKPDGTASANVASDQNKPPGNPVPVVRYGRYTLVELVPEIPQRDLMRQVIDVSIPSDANASVGDVMRYLLLHSGYRLCDATAGTGLLFTSPLPAAHRRLGPLLLRDALLILAGPAWDLSVDDSNREVCLHHHRRPAAGASGAPTPDEPPEPVRAEDSDSPATSQGARP